MLSLSGNAATEIPRLQESPADFSARTTAFFEKHAFSLTKKFDLPNIPHKPFEVFHQSNTSTQLEDRNVYMTHNLLELCEKHQHITAVLGAAHVKEVTRLFDIATSSGSDTETDKAIATSVNNHEIGLHSYFKPPITTLEEFEHEVEQIKALVSEAEQPGKSLLMGLKQALGKGVNTQCLRSAMEMTCSCDPRPII